MAIAKRKRPRAPFWALLVRPSRGVNTDVGATPPSPLRQAPSILDTSRERRVLDEDVNIWHCLVKSIMNYEGPTTWADFRHEAGWSLEERYSRKAKYERKQYSITNTEDISVYSLIFGSFFMGEGPTKGRTSAAHKHNKGKLQCIALHPPLLHAPCPGRPKREVLASKRRKKWGSYVGYRRELGT